MGVLPCSVEGLGLVRGESDLTLDSQEVFLVEHDGKFEVFGDLGVGTGLFLGTILLKLGFTLV